MSATIARSRGSDESALRERVLVIPATIRGEVGDEHRASDVLHCERLEITKAPPIRLDAAGGRLLLDPEVLTELLKEGGQTHGLPPSVRHALGRIIRGHEPWVNRAVPARL